MLSRKDWLIAKQMIFIASQATKPKKQEALIVLLIRLLSCRGFNAYILGHAEDPSCGVGELRAVKVKQEPNGKITVEPIQASNQSLEKQLQKHGGNAFPQLLEESKQGGAACAVRSRGNTVYAYAIVQCEAPKSAPPKQLLLTFSTVAELCCQRALLFETMLPTVSAHLHDYVFPSQPEIILTHREHQILNMIAVGYTAYRVACELDISERTVNFHLGKIYRKLGARNRQQAIHAALCEGVITRSGNGIRSLYEEEVFNIGGGQRIYHPTTTVQRVGVVVFDRVSPARMWFN